MADEVNENVRASKGPERESDLVPSALPGTGRVEAFSDGVFAIVITLLVLDLKDPAHLPGELAIELARQWPAYLSYTASFLYVAVIWLNHHQAFVGIRRVNTGLQWANVTLLFTTALIPFPTAVLSQSIIAGIDGKDAQTAVALYAGIAASMCASWFLLNHQVHRHRRNLLEAWADREAFGADRARSVVGVAVYTAAGMIGALSWPAIALAVFVMLPVFYACTSEGIRAMGHRRPGGTESNSTDVSNQDRDI